MFNLAYKKTIGLVFKIAMAVFLNFFLIGNIYAAEDVDDTRKDINKTQEQIDKEQKELEKSQSSLQVTNNQIYTTASLINKTEAELARKEAEINNLNRQVELNRKILKEYIQEMFINSQSDQMIGLAISDKLLNEYGADFDQMISVKQRVLGIMDEINQDKVDINKAKEELAEKKEDHQKLLQVKQFEKKETTADIVETQATIAELQKKLAELQSDLLALTGTSFSAKDIREAVEFASNGTGVPKGVLYGFLQMETKLGKNTGQCTYKEVEKVAVARYKSLLKKNKNWQASIDLLYKRQDIFYEIVKSLGYSKDKKVSCSPSGYIGQGGAMGVAQFMSDVWKGYESRITAKTGNGKPNPWSITDGVMAMAIKLRTAGATSDSSSAIKKASISYLGSFNSNYYNGIVYWSKNYKTLFQ